MLANIQPIVSRPLARYSVLLLLLFVALQSLYQASRGSAGQRFWLEQLTVAPSAAVISWLTPEETVVARGQSLASPYVRLSVLNGCEGTEVILLLTAALLALRLPWRRALLSILLGGVLVYAANQVRIVTLYYCLRFDRPLFDSLHSIVAPLAIIAMASIYFLYWLPHVRPQRNL